MDTQHAPLTPQKLWPTTSSPDAAGHRHHDHHYTTTAEPPSWCAYNTPTHRIGPLEPYVPTSPGQPPTLPINLALPPATLRTPNPPNILNSPPQPHPHPHAPAPTSEPAAARRAFFAAASSAARFALAAACACAAVRDPPDTRDPEPYWFNARAPLGWRVDSSAPRGVVPEVAVVAPDAVAAAAACCCAGVVGCVLLVVAAAAGNEVLGDGAARGVVGAGAGAGAAAGAEVVAGGGCWGDGGVGCGCGWSGC